jgi:DNA-binding transcriptional ArsR family regulator
MNASNRWGRQIRGGQGSAAATQPLTAHIRVIYDISMLINQTVKYNSISDPLTLIFAALADPTRRDILSRLAAGAMTVNEIASPYDMSLPAISKHLKILEQAGLLSQTRDAQFRPRHAQADALIIAAEWLRDNQHR